MVIGMVGGDETEDETEVEMQGDVASPAYDTLLFDVHAYMYGCMHRRIFHTRRPATCVGSTVRYRGTSRNS